MLTGVPSPAHVVILGAGLAGLTLAYRLRGSGWRVTILEARQRLGGRILTARPIGGAPIEMGATWLGRKHTRLTALLGELGLGIAPQPSGPYAYYESRAGGGAQIVQLPPDPAPSHVITATSSALVEALAARLGRGSERSALTASVRQPMSAERSEPLRLDHAVTSLTLDGEEVVVSGEGFSVRATHVVSTLPPNLFAQSVTCTPALPTHVTAFAKTCHTWMGESIKVGLAYREGFWSVRLRSGQASSGEPHNGRPIADTLFSNVGPLTECYDHSHAVAGAYALKGFVRPELATLTRAEREAAVVAQLVRVYGEAARTPLRYEECVWRDEAYTYAPYAEGGVVPHQHNGHPALREVMWGGRLRFGGSETAEAYPGYMDGAVEAGERCARDLLAATTTRPSAGSPPALG